MLLTDFERVIQDIARPHRNDRHDCEQRLLQTFQNAGLEPDQAFQNARHLALAMDLWPKPDSKPLFMWVDDRLTYRSPESGLPYDIGFATFLIPQHGDPYLFSIWEFAERNDRINLLLHHQDMPAGLSPQTPLAGLIASEPPSHRLYHDMRFVPFLYKPDTIAPLEAFYAPPDISAQSRFLKRSLRIDPAPGK